MSATVSMSDELVPQADISRQAVDSLRGYAYQIIATALAWLDIDEKSKIYIEVAEDYSIVAQDAINAIQVKDTQATGKITLNTISVQEAISNFIDLSIKNEKTIYLRYFTTSNIGLEKKLEDRPNGIAGLIYWRHAAKGTDIEPLRAILESNKFSETVHKFIKEKNNDELRKDLLQKIHWDCGQPDIYNLHKEFIQRLTIICRDTFNLPSQDSSRVSDNLLFYVLQKSVISNQSERVLTRADLYRCIDNASRISIPSTMIDTISKLLQGLVIPERYNTNLSIKNDSPSWLVKRSELYFNNKIIKRIKLENTIEAKLKEKGICFLVGASGMGKSLLSKLVMENINKNYLMVDLRDTSVEETTQRLELLISRLGGFHINAIILEDFNHFNNRNILRLILYIFSAFDRRDIPIIVTSYTSPTINILSSINCEPSSIINCPYFSQDETDQLVTMYGGNPKTWGRIAYISGGCGHPQLVFAFIAGIAARNWPESEITTIIMEGWASVDVNAEKEALYKGLISTLSLEAKNLIYRLSLLIGNFKKSMVFKLGNVSPPILDIGEVFNDLTGVWVEKIGKDNYRLSPLLSSIGKEMLDDTFQEEVHYNIASQFMSEKEINIADIEKIILYALLGKNDNILLLISMNILNSNNKIIDYLKENSSWLQLFDFEKLIYPKNLEISLILRLVQLKILFLVNKESLILNCVKALQKEFEEYNNKYPSTDFQILILLSLLINEGIANYLNNWVNYILLVKSILENNSRIVKELSKIKDNCIIDKNFLPTLFSIGCANLSGIEKLENVIKQLDEIDSSVRVLLLSHIKDYSSDYSVFVNSGWLFHDRNGTLDATYATYAAERYHYMAELTQEWGIRSLSIRFWIAEAIIFDEYLDEDKSALKILDQAILKLGNDIDIARAKAKLLYRAENYIGALSILRTIADEIGLDNPIERAFALRDAAISAANCNEWKLAKKWYIESQQSASLVNLPNMQIMSIGLIADAAVAMFNIGEIKEALINLSNVLTQIKSIKPELSLQAFNCHSMVRHTILWMKARIENLDIRLESGEILMMKPGICSNPDPIKSLQIVPLASLDIAWYILADCEIKSCLEVGISANIYHNIDGVIASLELFFRYNSLWCKIEKLDYIGFINYLLSYIEVKVLLDKHPNLLYNEDLVNPKYLNIPKISLNKIKEDIDIINSFNDALLAINIVFVCKGKSEYICDLMHSLETYLGDETIYLDIISRFKLKDNQIESINSLQELVFDTIKIFDNKKYIEPEYYFIGGVRFYLQAKQSFFKLNLISVIAEWQRKVWNKIITMEKFRLIMPLQTVPKINLALNISTNDEYFLCSLFLAIIPATKVVIPSAMIQSFKNMI